MCPARTTMRRHPRLNNVTVPDYRQSAATGAQRNIRSGRPLERICRLRVALYSGYRKAEPKPVTARAFISDMIGSRSTMEEASQRDITRLLQDWRKGDQGALEQLVPLIGRDLRRIANQRLGRAGQADASLTATSLVQEAYIRLLGDQKVDWQGRAHFFALCAEIIRGILVDHARARYAAKRGGGAPHVPLEEALGVSEERAPNLVAIDDALRELSKIDPRKGRVIELRFFGGLTVEETADVLHISPDSVARDWRLAKMWLMRQIDGAAFHGAS
jgi:RNA polymerase sigma-70 factor (ECF subfamily)